MYKFSPPIYASFTTFVDDQDAIISPNKDCESTEVNCFPLFMDVSLILIHSLLEVNSTFIYVCHEFNKMRKMTIFRIIIFCQTFNFFPTVISQNLL